MKRRKSVGKMADRDDETEKQVEMFKIKKLIKNLTAARGNGTSMISLIVPPGDQVSVGKGGRGRVHCLSCFSVRRLCIRAVRTILNESLMSLSPSVSSFVVRLRHRSRA